MTTSENIEIFEHLRKIFEATAGGGIYVWDRGADRWALLREMLRGPLAFVVRLRGDRHMVTEDGRRLSVWERASEVHR